MASSLLRRLSTFSLPESTTETEERTDDDLPNGLLPDDRLRNAYVNLRDATEQYQRYFKESKELVRSIKEASTSVQYDINEHFKANLVAMEEHRKRLLQEVHETCNSRIGKVEEEQSRAEKTVKRFKECSEHLKKSYRMSPAEDEYEAKINDICNKAEIMASNIPPNVRHNLAWMEFEKEKPPESRQCSRLKTDRTVRLELESEFGGGWLVKLAKARGIAVTMKGLIAVAESNASRVSVWEEVKGEYQRKFYLKTPWNIRGLNKPTDVAVISGDKFVVVDASGTFKVFSASGEYDDKEWVKEEGTNCVTSDPRLHESKRILMDSRKEIAVIKESGSFLRPITTGMISHAIATNGKKVAISNLKEVKIFDVHSGEQLLNFGARVRGLCFDDETKSILATTCDRQIGQFCASTGQLLDIISEEVLNDPWGLVIISGRRLAVADDQSVKVYRIIDP